MLYGTGHQRLNPQTNRQEKVGGVKYTIKDGIVYDAQKLLAEVAAEVAAEKKKMGTGTTTAQVRDQHEPQEYRATESRSEGAREAPAPRGPLHLRSRRSPKKGRPPRPAFLQSLTCERL